MFLKKVNFLRFYIKNASNSCLYKCRTLSIDAGSNKEDIYDVVISGGGMVGTAMASSLGNEPLFEGRKALLLEASPQKEKFRLPENHSNRVCALSPVTAKFLGGFGAWDHILNMRAQPIRKMQVTDACSEALITFDREKHDENLAYIVENDVILAAVTKSLSESKNEVEVSYGTKLKHFEVPRPSTEGTPLLKIVLEDGRTIQTKLLIGAEGVNSPTRKAADMHTVSWDYDNYGLVATLELAEPYENIVAWQRFLPTGPVALLPLTNSRSSLVWSTTKARAEELVKMDSEEFVDELNHALFDNSLKNGFAVQSGEALTQLMEIVSLGSASRSQRQLPPTIGSIVEGSRAKFPLGLMHSSHYVKRRLALIGDAAHRIHPLAGQGVNLGFADAAELRDVIARTISLGGDIGALSNLTEYETARQRHVIPVMASIDGLYRLYGNSFTPLVTLRSLGLQFTNSIGPLKEKIMEYAMYGIRL